jgi:uncharacterized membrane protein YeaQ/YmgE (transglycosylase-associated protein family)
LSRGDIETRARPLAGHFFAQRPCHSHRARLSPFPDVELTLALSRNARATTVQRSRALRSRSAATVQKCSRGLKYPRRHRAEPTTNRWKEHRHRLSPRQSESTGRAVTYRDGRSAFIIVVVGIVAGWLAGHFVQSTGFGILGDFVIEVIGAFIAGWLLPQLGVNTGHSVVAAIISATIGAVLLLLVVRLVRGGGGWSGGWRRGWSRRWSIRQAQAKPDS